MFVETRYGSRREGCEHVTYFLLRRMPSSKRRQGFPTLQLFLSLLRSILLFSQCSDRQHCKAGTLECRRDCAKLDGLSSFHRPSPLCHTVSAAVVYSKQRVP